MSPRSAPERELLRRRIGTDLALRYLETAGMFADADFAVRSGPPRGITPGPVDIDVVADVPAAVQFLANRLKTHKGELAPLGHPEYGSRHHELIGEPNVARTRNLIKLYVLEAMRHEPRIAKILDCTVRAAHDPPRDLVRIEMEVRLIDAPNPLNLVVPFSLGAGI